MSPEPGGPSHGSHAEAQDTAPKTDRENGDKSKPQTDESEGDWSKRLDKAAADKNIVIVKELLKTREKRMKAPPVEGDPKRKGAHKHKTTYGNTGLIKALFTMIKSEQEENEITQCLIDAEGIKLDKKIGGWDRTSLHQAVVHQNYGAVKQLLNHPQSANFIDLRDCLGRTALHEAVWRQSNKIFDLLASRANVDVTDEKSMTALHVAIWRNKDDKRVQSLIEDYGAEVNTRDLYGDSPLHEACNNCNARAIELLVSAGADREVKNVEGRTPKEVISDLGNEIEDKEKIKSLLTQPRRVTARKYVPKIPQSRPKCLPREESTCKDFTAYVRYYCRGSSHTQATSATIHGLVYESQSTLEQIEREFLSSHEDYEKVKPNYENPQAPRTMKDSIASSSEDSGKNWQASSKERPNRAAIWKWIHFPANNMTWIRDFIRTITHDLGHAEQEPIWEFVERTIKDRKFVTKGGCSRIAHVEDWPKESQLEASGDIRQRGPCPGNSNPSRNAELVQDERSSPTSALSGKRLSIVCPYIDFETEEYIGYKYPPLWWTSSRSKPTDHSIKMAILEETYPRFSGLSGLQVPQTLDSSYYDTLDEDQLYDRVHDQVVLRWFNRNKGRSGMLPRSHSQSSLKSQRINEDGQSTTNAEIPLGLKAPYGRRPMEIGAQAKLLMVHQLWLWKLDENTIITSCPDRWHAGVEDTLIDTIRQSGVENLDEPERLIQHIIYECVSFLDEFRDAGVGEHILDIFDSSASRTAQLAVEALKDFQVQTASEGGQQRSVSRKEAFGLSYLNEVGASTVTKKPRRKDNLSATKEINLMCEVKDLSHEILFLRRVFDTQAEVLKKLARILWSDAEEEAKQSRQNYIDMCGMMDLIDRTIRLDENTTRTLQGLDYLVQVKQAQIALYETRTARTLNHYIMLFTIVTILFMPLSFMTSLFAIPINQFPHNDEGEPRYTPGWLAWRMVVGEVVTILFVAIIGVLIWRPRRVQRLLWGFLTLPFHPRRLLYIVLNPRESFKDLKFFAFEAPPWNSAIGREMLWDVDEDLYGLPRVMAGHSRRYRHQ